MYASLFGESGVGVVGQQAQQRRYTQTEGDLHKLQLRFTVNFICRTNYSCTTVNSAGRTLPTNMHALASRFQHSDT
jgi:hypothetical protein